jgi:hypothetical protein
VVQVTQEEKIEGSKFRSAWGKKTEALFEKELKQKGLWCVAQVV